MQQTIFPCFLNFSRSWALLISSANNVLSSERTSFTRSGCNLSLSRLSEYSTHLPCLFSIIRPAYLKIFKCLDTLYMDSFRLSMISHTASSLFRKESKKKMRNLVLSERALKHSVYISIFIILLSMLALLCKYTNNMMICQAMKKEGVKEGVKSRHFFS